MCLHIAQMTNQTQSYMVTSSTRTPPPRTLQKAHAQRPTVVQGGRQFLMSEVPLHHNTTPTPQIGGRNLNRGGLVFEAHRLVYHSA